MASPMDLFDNLEALDIPQIASDLLYSHAPELAVKNRVQLLEGRLSTGDVITPSYYEDPFFKSRAHAEWYATWKEEITPNPKRAKGTPNLYIDGTFHGTIKVYKEGVDLAMGSDSPIADDLEKTFTRNIYGLDETSRQDVIEEERIDEQFAGIVKESTGLK